MAEAVLDKDPYNAESWFMLGGIFNELKNTEKAEWAFDYSCTISEQFFEARVGYLEAIYQNEKYSVFIEKFDIAKQEFGDALMAPLKGLYAWSHFEIEDVDKARKTYRKILKNYPLTNTLFDTIIITINDNLVDLFLKKKISFIDISKNLLNLSKSKEFQKFKKIKPKNVDDIYNLKNYVSLKMTTLGI